MKQKWIISALTVLWAECRPFFILSAVTEKEANIFETYIHSSHPWKALQVMGKSLRALNLRFSLFFTEVKGVYNSPPTWAEADHVIMFSLRTVFGDRTQTALGWLSHIQGSHQLHRELSNEPWENGRTPLQLLLVAWATHKLISWPLESLCLLPPPKLQGVHIRLLLSLLDASLSSTKRGNVEIIV